MYPAKFTPPATAAACPSNRNFIKVRPSNPQLKLILYDSCEKNHVTFKTIERVILANGNKLLAFYVETTTARLSVKPSADRESNFLQKSRCRASNTTR
jgi:hypothetical protein